MQVYGADKVWKQMNRERIAVARCTVERLMKQLGLRGVMRGKRVRTTVPDAIAPRPLDRVNRQFKAARPNQLWVSDFTYDRLNPPNTRPLPSAAAAVTPACAPRWARSAIASTTPYARASSRHSNANCLRVSASIRVNKHDKRCSRGSKVGTTSAVVIAASVTARRSATSNFTKNKTESASRTSCPPPAGVVVVTGDPPADRGQLVARLKPEGTSLVQHPVNSLIK